jgi:GT2 family glycosyltransferase/glycosyltransferase involved in cell wall biosynthesis/SAM-dependent methyltransferase
MSIKRREGAPRLIDWTGERCVPWAPDVPVIYEHYHRYLWAASVVEGRRVLDLGSGEGFGAAILADSAAHVLGLDVDEPTVEHSRLNYAGPNLEFELGTATDLTAHPDGSFGAVVAFEVIEHVLEQERVLAEVARVLSDDGILVISTPDRRMYSKMRAEPNIFHKRELELDEFLELLGTHFPHIATWGQRTVAGSHLSALGEGGDKDNEVSASEFFIERAGDEWVPAGAPAPLYCVALASRARLPRVAASSTLADCGLELMRVKERDADELDQKEEAAGILEREKEALSESLELERADHSRAIREHDLQARRAREQRDEEILGAEEKRSQETLANADQTIIELKEQLAASRQANRRAEESVIWQAFQRSRSRVYGAIGGERSRRARALGALLRFAGRPLGGRLNIVADAPEVIQMPEFDRPEVSLIIPVHSHAPLTRACLRSIRDCTVNVAYEVILIDDTADEETRKLLDNVRGAKILHNETNLGFLRSMNRGASVAQGDWLVLFNNDTEVTRGWLAAMVECANSAEDVGVVTPKFIYPDGTLNEAGGIVWRDGYAANYGRGDAPDRFQYEYRRETDYGSAAALMVRARLWRDTGGFDERYRPIYYEDTDMCFQAREQGLRVLYEPGAVVVHIEGATSGTDPSSGAKRHQEQNRRKFVRKWRGRLEAEHMNAAPGNIRDAANRHRGPHVLVIDHRVPMWDRDSGSLRMFSVMQALIRLGARVTFMPDNLARIPPYTRRLQRMGVEVMYELDYTDIRTEMVRIGPGLSTAILCRPHTASRWLDTVREYAPAATIVYDTVDLHWLREARRNASAVLTNSLVGSNGSPDPASIWPKAKALRELELAMIRATDATLVVSDGERSQVEHDVPGANVVVVPNVHDIASYVPPPTTRSGILFVGSFEHVPNVDAAVGLVKEVMPAVWGELGEVRLTIVGSDPPPEVRALASPLVDVTGWVEDLQPLLEEARLMVAPLRYGAGLKGKVTQCLAYGLPVVTTSIGAEGILIAPGEANETGSTEQYLLVADDAREMASQTIKLYRDDDLWRRLSGAGQAFIAERCSTELVATRLNGLLGRGLSMGDDDVTQQVLTRLSRPSVRAGARSEPGPHGG